MKKLEIAMLYNVIYHENVIMTIHAENEMEAFCRGCEYLASNFCGYYEPDEIFVDNAEN